MNPLTIFVQVSLPVFILIGVGYFTDKTFKYDLKSLTRLLFYLLNPVIILHVTMNTELGASDLAIVLGAILLHYLILSGISFGIFSAKPLKEKRTILTLASAFRNNANYGIPLMLLAFGEIGVSISAAFIIINSLLLFTGGIAALSAGEGTRKEMIRRLASVPSIYAAILGLVFRFTGVTLPDIIAIPFGYLKGAYTAMALLLLGAQLSRIKIGGHPLPLALASSLRLIASPLLMWGLASLLGMSADLAAMLIVGSAVPTAVNVFVVASEFGADPEIASEIIFTTTLISALTLPVIMALVGV